MKKWLATFLISVIFLFAQKAYAQTYTQTFIDRCTGETKLATTTIINGNATVSFYNQVRTFTPFEVQTGLVQTWLFTTKATYEAFTCPVINTPVVQQTVTNAVAQTASNAASQAASSAASSAASTVVVPPPPPTTPPPTTPPPASGSSTPPPASGSSTSSNSGGSTSSSSSSSSSSSENKSGSSSSSSEQKSETKSESKSESSESKSESKEESKSESKSEEKQEESKSEEKKEESKEEKKEEKKKEKAAPSNPMLLASDLSTIESPDGRWLQSATIGISKASMAGDESYSATTVVMSDLKTFIVGGGYTKLDFSEGKLNTIHSYSSAFAYLNGTYMNLLGYTHIKPTQKYGVLGYNLGVINLLIKDATGKYGYSLSTSAVGFWTKPYQYSKKLTISPQIFTMLSPIAYNTVSKTTTVNRNIGFLLGSSFDYKISKRFGFSINYKLSGNTAAGSPFLSNILIGSRMIL